MSVLGGGGEIGACIPSDGNVYEVTAAGTFDSAKARCSINIGSVANFTSHARWDFTASTTTAWVGFMGYGARPQQNGWYDWLKGFDSSGNQWVAVQVSRFDGTGSLATYVRVLYNNGSSFVQVGSTALVMMTLQKFDLNINVGASGSIDLYVGSSAIIQSGVINTAAFTNIKRFEVWAPFGSCNVSEVILASDTTTRRRLYTDYPTAAGATSAWTGSYADVDEIVYSDVDGLSSTSNGDVTTVTGSSPSLGGFAVDAVIVAARAALGTTGPTGVQLVLRPSSTDRVTATIVQTAGFGASVGVWSTDPDTSAAWASAAAISAKFGVKAIT